MAYVTYLLGAGASAQAIPPVNGMAKSLLNAGDIITRKFLLPNSSLKGQLIEPKEHNDKVKEIRDEFEWLANICGNHYSVDTYAKKLFIKNGKDSLELLRLKNTLSLYFTIQQIINFPDIRYDNFWASVLNTKSDFPDKIRIISWNYDSQLELSYKDFVSSTDLNEAYKNINAISFYDDLTRFSSNKFGVFKLNGSAKSYKVRSGSETTSFLLNKFEWPTDENKIDTTSFFDELYNLYGKLKINPMLENQVTAISFAWEHDLESDYYLKLKESIWNTQTLVVVGYSFPFFNRKIDQRIINEYMPNLDKVYFQAPESDVENLKERFLTLSERKRYTSLVKDLNQFYFPNELEV